MRFSNPDELEDIPLSQIKNFSIFTVFLIFCTLHFPISHLVSREEGQGNGFQGRVI